LEIGMLALIQTIVLALDLYWWIIIASAIFSWLYAFNVINANNQVIATIGRSLYQLTEPIYRPIRRVLPNFGGVDLSPLVVLVILFFLEQVIRSVLAPAVL
uniref:YggT family protein n=1 Tax=Shinella sp. TaxID=1870904 RepID=UPI003F71BEAD